MMDPKLKGKKVGIQAGAPAADYIAKAGLMPDAKSVSFHRRYPLPESDAGHGQRRALR